MPVWQYQYSNGMFNNAVYTGFMYAIRGVIVVAHATRAGSAVADDGRISASTDEPPVE